MSEIDKIIKQVKEIYGENKELRKEVDELRRERNRYRDILCDFHGRRMWVNAEVPCVYADKLKKFLHDIYLAFEPSECGDMIHFEIYANNTEIEVIEDFLQRLYKGKERRD